MAKGLPRGDSFDANFESQVLSEFWGWKCLLLYTQQAKHTALVRTVLTIVAYHGDIVAQLITTFLVVPAVLTVLLSPLSIPRKRPGVQ